MTPEELIHSLLGHLLVNGMVPHDGPRHLNDKSVLYVKDHDGKVLRLEVRAA